MRILILEDDENRIKKFRENFIGCDLFITKNPQEANQWLEGHEFDIIFLDHDLEDSHYLVDTVDRERTGLCTAEFLGNNLNLCKNATVIVHSLNPSGRTRMMQALGTRVKHEIPFVGLFQRLIIDKSL
jgi:CheY-like chemotaxis protein